MSGSGSAGPAPGEDSVRCEENPLDDVQVLRAGRRLSGSVQAATLPRDLGADLGHEVAHKVGPLRRVVSVGDEGDLTPPFAVRKDSSIGPCVLASPLRTTGTGCGSPKRASD